MTNRSIILIAHNLRSCHNVGSLLRTAEGLGIDEVILSGYTPYPLLENDSRLPHISAKIHKQVQKTALGAERTQKWSHEETIEAATTRLRNNGFTLAAIEQDPSSIDMTQFIPPQKIALLVGREVVGVEPEVLSLMDNIVEIPMFGSKESFNVVQAAAMALYHCKFAA